MHKGLKGCCEDFRINKLQRNVGIPFFLKHVELILCNRMSKRGKMRLLLKPWSNNNYWLKMNYKRSAVLSMKVQTLVHSYVRCYLLLNHNRAPCFYSWSRHNIFFFRPPVSPSDMMIIKRVLFSYSPAFNNIKSEWFAMWLRANMKLVCQGVHVCTQAAVCAVADVQWWHQHIVHSVLRESSINHSDPK